MYKSVAHDSNNRDSKATISIYHSVSAESISPLVGRDRAASNVSGFLQVHPEHSLPQNALETGSAADN